MEITEAKALPGYRLELRFDNGEHGVVDLTEFVGRGVFSAWETPGVFEQVAVTTEGAVEWPAEIDMCPDSLYLRMTGKKPEDLFPSLDNRKGQQKGGHSTYRSRFAAVRVGGVRIPSPS